MAPHQRLIPLENRLEWQMALTGIPHAFGHTWESCHAMHLTTGSRHTSTVLNRTMSELFVRYLSVHSTPMST